MCTDDRQVSTAKNLCTVIQSFDIYNDDKQLIFEPNLSSVWCRNGHALSVKEIPCTAVTNVIFNTKSNLSLVSIEVWRYVIGKRLLFGITTEKSTGHHNHVIGDMGFPSFGIELMYDATSSSDTLTKIRVRFVESSTVDAENEIKSLHPDSKKGHCFYIKSKGSIGKDVLSVEFVNGFFVFDCNGQQLYSVRKTSFERFRIGFSFLSQRQEARISSQNEKQNCKVSPFDQGTFLSLPQKVGGNCVHTFISNSSALLITGDSILCTSDATQTAITAEIFRNIRWEGTPCRGCGTKSILTNKWQCMNCTDFDLCQVCFSNFAAQNQSQELHSHAADQFTCSLGGERNEIAFRIDDFDDDGSFMFFGIVPSLYEFGTNHVGNDCSSYGLKIGKKISVWGQGSETPVTYSRSLLVGDIVCIAVEKDQMHFSINGTLVYTLKIEADLYRFALTLQRSNQALSVVSGDFACCLPRGALVQITSDQSMLQKYSKSCNVQPAFDVVGHLGTVVDVGDSDGTVGVSFRETFKWIPRRCCHIMLSPEENSLLYRHALVVPYEGDHVLIHPCAPDGWKALRGGLRASVSKVHITHSESECIDTCLVYQLCLDTFLQNNEDESFSYNYCFNQRNIGSLLVDLEVSFQVVRNPYFWRWGTQDGQTEKATSSLNFAIGWAIECPNSGWVTVYWERTRICERYRFGYDNAFDVLCIRRATDMGYKPMGSIPNLREHVPRNPEMYASFIKECHFIPIAELNFSMAHELGRGRFGMVHKATWGAIDVAIKEISHPDIHQARDLGVLSRITHPNAVHILGWSADEANKIYLVMKLITPGSLAKVIRAQPKRDVCNGGPLGWDHFFDISIGVAHALHYFARQDLVHRDIKPENILLEYTDDGYIVRVTDFGLAKFIQRDESADLTNVCGTPAYMSPEAWDRGKKISAKADVFSLGMVMYNMLTGKTPRCECENAFQILYDLITLKNTVQPPPETPTTLSALILSCQDIDPAKRPTAMEVIRQLHQVQDNIRELDKFKSLPYEEMDSCIPHQEEASTVECAENSTDLSSLACKSFSDSYERKSQNASPSDLVVASPNSNLMEFVTFRDLTQCLGFTHDSAKILLLLSEVKRQLIPPVDENFTEDKRRLILHEAIDQFLISMKLVAIQTKMNYEHLFSLITRAGIPILTKQPSSGIKTYFVMVKHYSRILSNVLAHSPLHQIPPPVRMAPTPIPLSEQQKSLLSASSSLQERNQRIMLENNSNMMELNIKSSPSKQCLSHGSLQNIRFGPPAERLFVKGNFNVKYLSFKNFCLAADLESLSLISLINHKVITPKRIFGNTYRISCDQKEIIDDCTIPIEKFQASCALTSTEIRAFALVLDVPVLYRPKTRMFCLLYDDISERIMPEIENAAQIRSRSEFWSFLQIANGDVAILEERGILKRYLAFEPAQVFDYITHIMQNLIPMLMAQQEMQSLLDLTQAEFDEMLKDYVATGSLYGPIYIKKKAYLLREEIQRLIRDFSECE